MKVPKHIEVQPGWFDIGTMTKETTVAQFHAAKWRDALATCSLWVRSAAGLHGKTVSGDPGQVYHSRIDWLTCDLLGYSVQLLRTLVDGTQNYNEKTGDMPMYDLFVQAAFQYGYLEIKDASVASGHFVHMNLDQADAATAERELLEHFPQDEELS